MKKRETLEDFKKPSRLDNFVTLCLLFFPIVLTLVSFIMVAYIEYKNDNSYQPKVVETQEREIIKHIKD